MQAPYDIVCFSHLSWNPQLFQRPQQIMSRMATRGHRVTYVSCTGAKEWAKTFGAGNSDDAGTGSAETVAGDGLLQIISVPVPPQGCDPRSMRGWLSAGMIGRKLKRKSPQYTDAAVLWLYHPGLLPLARAVASRGDVRTVFVYDIMDRFDSFQAAEGASDHVARHEERLLSEANIVFAGGRSLQLAANKKLELAGRPAAHCLPSGVDLGHFATAFSTEPFIEIPADVRNLPKPIIGYYGAVDERIDFELLKQVALAFSRGTVLLVGPVLSSATRDGFPQNLQMIGPRAYVELPAYLAAFDVCLLPFRKTPLVAHVSPTKTPEYLAGGKPVVSTPIPDVIANWGDVVRVATTAEMFVRNIEAALADGRPPEEFAQAAAARAQTWDQIAADMDELVSQVIEGGAASAADHG